MEQPLNITRNFEEIERLFTEAEPILNQLIQKTGEIAKLPNLAEYGIINFANDLVHRLQTYRQQVKAIERIVWLRQWLVEEQDENQKALILKCIESTEHLISVYRRND